MTVSQIRSFRYSFFLRSLLVLLAFIISLTVKSQLCTGSLGDPAVNITFGTGGTPSNYVPTDSYTYLSSSCPNDGFYTVTTATSNCFGNTWHTVSSDHTGGGAFMLVNASYAPGDFFVTTVTDLCPNTTYEFAAWIMNVITRFGSIKPDITFNIETPAGTVLNSFNTGGIDVTTSPVWKQYGFFFTTPADNAAIVLRMTNNAPGGIGNDVALDDITFRPCGSKIEAKIAGNSTDTINVCEGNTNSYTFNSDGGAGYISPVYRWQISTDKGITWADIPGATTLTYKRTPTNAPGSYWYRLTVVEASVGGISSCRISSNLLIINIHPTPLVNAGPDRVMISGYPIDLKGQAEGEQIVYKWSPNSFINDISILSPTISPPADIAYTLSASSPYGCVNADTAAIKVVAGIFVPTAFTPNGDGKNDTWQIPFLDPSLEGDVSVYNRYGQLVYHVEAAKVSWNGKFKGEPQRAGTYVFMINFKNKSYKNIKGVLTLIR